MRNSKKSILNQRSIIHQKHKLWLNVTVEKPPPSGWIRAIRKSLGMSSRQLAERMGVTQSTAYALEQREAKSKITLESLEKAANAMECRLVYALVPREPHIFLTDILRERAMQVAKKIVESAEHSMKLEGQGRTKEQIQESIEELANELVNEVDSRIWESEE